MSTALGAGISLLVPFRDDHAEGRLRNWNWLRQYWRHALPDAQLVIGDAPGTPFSKTCALNAAFRESSGDVIVLLDADCYISPTVILECAERIRVGRSRDPQEPVWFVPYRHLYRLTDAATHALIRSDPRAPHVFNYPPPPSDVNTTTSSAFGHWFGALIQIMPRIAFETVHGMDPRYRGWGGEDVAFTLALDTLFGVHRLSSNQVFTLWHPINSIPGTNANLLRTWEGQNDPRTNWKLAGRYRKALRDPVKMAAIINEWVDDPQYRENRIDVTHDE